MLTKFDQEFKLFKNIRNQKVSFQCQYNCDFLKKQYYLLRFIHIKQERMPMIKYFSKSCLLLILSIYYSISWLNDRMYHYTSCFKIKITLIMTVVLDIRKYASNIAYENHFVLDYNVSYCCNNKGQKKIIPLKR